MGEVVFNSIQVVAFDSSDWWFRVGEGAVLSTAEWGEAK